MRKTSRKRQKPPSEEERAKQVIRERALLDQELSKFQRPIAVMAVNMEGTTAFFDVYGDVAGFVRTQMFVERVRVAVLQNGGIVGKAAGDALLAWFDDPADSVRAAIQLLRELRVINESTGAYEWDMHVRLGLNYGPALIKNNEEPFGHAVKLAARIQSIAAPDQILISALLEDRIGDAGFKLRKVSEAAALPGGEHVEVHEVLWR